MAGKMRIDGSSSSSGSGDTNSNSRGKSVVADCGRRKSSCGYCRSPNRSSISHGPSFFLNWCSSWRTDIYVCSVVSLWIGFDWTKRLLKIYHFLLSFCVCLGLIFPLYFNSLISIEKECVLLGFGGISSSFLCVDTWILPRSDSCVNFAKLLRVELWGQLWEFANPQ